MNGLVYVATNKINGKQYVGLTKRTLKDRWNQHINVANKHANTYFHHAIVKYGADSFDVVQVASAIGLKYLADLERLIIASVKPAYNQTNGGEVTLGRKYNDATKEIIRLKNTGKKRTKEQCERSSKIKKQQYIDRPELLEIAKINATKGRLAVDETKRIDAVRKAQTGRKMSFESRAKLSASCMGRVYGRDVIERMSATKRKAIKCSDGRVFECRDEAAEVTGISKQSIWRVCNGKYPSVRGLSFSYINGSLS
jgi:group I intron endonuclease